MTESFDNADLDAYVVKFFTHVPGLLSVIITDREGVVLAKARPRELNEDSLLSSTAATAADQASKCGLGQCRSLVSFYKDNIYVFISYLPLVVTFVGSLDLNVGLILGVQDELRKSLDPLQRAVKSADDM
eukprot:TRINITY_DN1321_c0_g1_i2.p1 TRINITY_DN1321_c0_g1~~TRINITY_DN1321_c0_g1_i2.p1  ORF type:complete len:130 (+),score=8.71 TRINITY_DN1321_c0_g1_i2:102-491(+)